MLLVITIVNQANGRPMGIEPLRPRCNYMCHSQGATKCRPSWSSAWGHRYFGEFPNFELSRGSGAYHGSDLNQDLSDAQHSSVLLNTKLDKDVSASWALQDILAGDWGGLGGPLYDPNSKLDGCCFVTDTNFEYVLFSDGQVDIWKHHCRFVYESVSLRLWISCG